jgi:hypothetical protein
VVLDGGTLALFAHDKKRPVELNCTPKVGHQSNSWGVFHDEVRRKF